MRSPKPVIAFVQQSATERWAIEVRDFAKFREVLGPDVVCAFSCCFVHVDRLVSLTSFAHHSLKQYAEDSPAFGRNLQTMVWFVVGTLRELALSIRDLRSSLAKRGLLDPNSRPWVKLRELEDRWEDDPFYREMRNIVAFHVDSDVVEKGLVALTVQDTVVIIQGDGGKQDQSSLRLGLEALLMGSEKNLVNFNTFIGMVANDYAAASAINEAFLLVLERVGIPPMQVDERG